MSAAAARCLAFAVAIALAPAASADEFDDDPLLDEEMIGTSDLEADPIEPANRVVFGANDHVYRFVFDPLADGYAWLVPRSVRASVRRFFANLEEPSVMVNRALRTQGGRAGRSGARFVVNSTLGVAGLFDPATRLGLPAQGGDFGETLAVYGAPDGVYLVIPLLGPSNVRDAVGALVDGALRPDTWLLAVGPQVFLGAGEGLAEYETQRLQLDELRAASFDHYAAMRSAWRMQREAEIVAARAEASSREADVDPDPELARIPPPASLRPLRSAR